MPRYRTGDAEIDQQIAELIAQLGDDVRDSDLLFELMVSTVRLARDHVSRGDLKMANAALKEMRYAFAVFEPYRSARKAAIFGSARTTRDDPLYDQTRARSRASSPKPTGWSSPAPAPGSWRPASRARAPPTRSA